ncbi:SRPBCC family protein [Demequina sp. NBRC 110055]|uniref:SRPBCC family protein n=1 Tax=Demequina sp. NBRC 110055 TaxID=1570344 RepID=UPI0009FE1D36|nr:SRPBCC family protein [Demequina sp. NBRC 110055]
MSDEWVEVTKDINATPEGVWSVVTDLDSAPEVMRNIVAVERLEGDGFSVGTRWKETRRMFGRDEAETMWVSDIDEPRSYTVQSRAGGALYTTVFRLTPTEMGTELVVTFGAETEDPGMGQRVMMALFGKAAMKATRKALVEDLDDIAVAAEKVGS